MARGGVIPMRESELQRPRYRKGGDVKPVTKGTFRKVSVPRVNPDWHPVVQNLFRSLKESGQSDFYQNSDWQFAYLLCDDLDSYKRDEEYRQEQMEARREWDAIYNALPSGTQRYEYKRDHPTPSVPRGGSAVKLQTAYDGLARLMTTEADRRRLSLELHAPTVADERDASVIAIDEYRARLDSINKEAA